MVPKNVFATIFVVIVSVFFAAAVVIAGAVLSGCKVPLLCFAVVAGIGAVGLMIYPVSRFRQRVVEQKNDNLV